MGSDGRKTDLRVIKTKRVIYKACIHLIHEKGLQQMTVQDVLDEALINRKTFYNYYHDKYDVVEAIGYDFLQWYDAAILERFTREGSEWDPFEGILELYDELYKRRYDLSAIWQIKTSNLNIIEEMSARLKQVYEHLALSQNVRGDVHLQASMFSAFVLSTYRYIMELDTSYDAQAILAEYRSFHDVLVNTMERSIGGPKAGAAVS